MGKYDDNWTDPWPNSDDVVDTQDVVDDLRREEGTGILPDDTFEDYNRVFHDEDDDDD